MTYRFAMAAFWAAVALAEVDLPAPLDHPGTIKGLLLRHLRWWTKHENMFNSDRVFNIGFAFPNMYMSESYNSPQSPYWCLKSFVASLLPADHVFWTSEEQPHPSAGNKGDVALTGFIKTPSHLMCNWPEHHFLLSAGQTSAFGHKAREAKYCKFAYSSAFGFSVPTGPLLEQTAPDSTVGISVDAGATWKVRLNPQDVRLESRSVAGRDGVSCLVSIWRPLKGLEVETTLVAVGEVFPGWHLRVHSIRWTEWFASHELADGLELIDGGFAISSVTAKDYRLPRRTEEELKREGIYSTDKECLWRSDAGASGITAIQGASTPEGVSFSRKSQLLHADANTNIIEPKTCIPTTRCQLSGGSGQAGEVKVATGVFCVMAGSLERVDELWGAGEQVRGVLEKLIQG